MEQSIHSGQTLWGKTRITLQMINWDHTVFALGFALTGVLVAAHGIRPLPTLGWILAGMVAAPCSRRPIPGSGCGRFLPGVLPPGFVLAFALTRFAVFEL